jgi:hypothetical protein
VRRVALALALGIVLVACGDYGGGGGSDPESAEARACADAPQFALGGEVALAPGTSAFALPPEPLEDLLPDAQTIVTGEVTDVLYEGTPPPTEATDEPIAGPIPPDRCQVVRLVVDEVLLGEAASGDELVLVKPEAPYVLETGDTEDGRPYLLNGATPYPVILGRYGPGNYSLDQVERALG